MGAEKVYTMVGIGEVLWDMLPSGRQLGGAPANFAYHANALGARGISLSAIGADTLGDDILQTLENIGLTTEFIARDAEHPTGTVTVSLDASGKPEYTIHEGVAWDYIPQVVGMEELAASADAVCFGSLAQRSPASRETIAKFLGATRKECLRIFDINLRQHYFDWEIIKKSLEMATFLKINDEELPVVARMAGIGETEDEVCGTLMARFGLGAVALTKGPEGSVLYAGSERDAAPSPDVEIVDTVGAGDSFTAALALGLLKGFPLRKINENAAKLASFVCSCHGATPEHPAGLLGC